MLAIPIQEEGPFEPALAGGRQTGVDGGALSSIRLMLQHERARGTCDAGSVITRTVIDHKDAFQLAPEAGNNQGHTQFLV